MSTSVPPQPVGDHRDSATDSPENHDGEDDDEALDSEDDEDDDDDDDEAEAIARRLGDQLWADINRAHAARVVGKTYEHEQQPCDPQSISAPTTVEAVIATMKTVLAFADSDPLVHSTLFSTLVPGMNDCNVLDILKTAVNSETVTPDVAGPLSQVIVTLARSEVLFSPLPTLQNGKRKRGDLDDEGARAAKRAAGPQQDLQTQLTEAVGVITAALNVYPSNVHPSPQFLPLDPSVIASIQLQLHQVFLFAVTSSAGAGQEMSALQEISGLIQALGVLSGIQITATAPQVNGDSVTPSQPPHPDPAAPWTPQQTQAQQVNDIGTAVYPCLIPGCKKTFSRLYSLRQHQRAHSVHRPFKCELCPASFARNHDLKRHVKGHDRRAFRCCGCGKVFSRRDAIKRHKTSAKRGVGCSAAATEEVEVAGGAKEGVREGRRAKMWSGIASAEGAVVGAVGVDGLEEGELRPEVVVAAQAAVTHLYALLHGRVASALGTSGIPAVPPGLASAAASGQTTLASVIARATAAANASVMAYGASPSEGPAMASLLPPSPDQMAPEPAVTSLSDYGLNEDQAKLLEQAIATATAAAQAQAEAEAMLEEEEEQSDDDEESEELGDEAAE